MRRRILLFVRAAALASLVVAGAACSDTAVIGPANQLEVSNAPGTFQWQVIALDKVTQTLTYTWTNNGATANVNQDSSVSSGTATLRITDASGTEVYSASLSQNGTFQTGAGTPGDWMVVVTLDKASGAANFRLQTP